MKKELIMKYPASCYSDIWREATPLGNGETGALLYGGIGHDIIAINHSKLWRDKNKPFLPDVHEHIETMRALLSENKVKEAENVIADALKEKGFNGASFGRPLPLCDIDMVFACNEAFKDYERVLDMETEEAVVSWNEGNTTFKKRVFVSRNDGNVYCKITASGDYCINVIVDLKVHDLQTIGELTLPAGKTTYKTGFVFFGSEWDEEYGAVAKVTHDGTETIEENGIHITNAKSVELVLKTFVDGKSEQQFSDIEKHLSNAPDYETAFMLHMPLHKALFNSSTFKLSDGNRDTANELLLMDAYGNTCSDELVEKLWSFGRYLLVCSNCENGLPCHLYGLWCGDYNGMWAYNMFNVNLEMIYWQALSGNMPNLLHNVFNYVEEHMDDYRENAMKLFGCRGINICSVSTPESGLHKLVLPHILHWTGGAGWIAQHYFDYYLYTRDTEFLKRRALPFMYEAALFYEDYFTVDKNGYFVSSPSNSPENVPLNVLNMGCNSEVTVNATMDFAIAKELFTNLLKGIEITGMYSEKAEKLKEMLKKIPPYQINEDGALSEWMHPFYKDNYKHRHESHLYPVFPGTEITKNSNPELYEAAVKAVEKREIVGMREQSGWSLAYMANTYSRLGYGDKALNAIDMLAKSCVLSNLFTTHNDWRRMGVATCAGMETKAPVQLDANMGITSAINEMFVFSTANELYLFNAMPSRWGKGEIGPLLTRTNTEVSLNWNDQNATAFLKQKSTEENITLVLPSNMIFEENGKRELSVTFNKFEEKEFKIIYKNIK